MTTDKQAKKNKIIVAEISKGWYAGHPVIPTPLISSQFETVINFNLKRGYVLKEWKYLTTPNGSHLIETIIAIFGRKPKRPEPFQKITVHGYGEDHEIKLKK